MTRIWPRTATRKLCGQAARRKGVAGWGVGGSGEGRRGAWSQSMGFEVEDCGWRVYLVAVDDSFDTVCDDEERRLSEAAAHRALHDVVRVVVHGSRCFVHYHHLFASRTRKYANTHMHTHTRTHAHTHTRTYTHTKSSHHHHLSGIPSSLLAPIPPHTCPTLAPRVARVARTQPATRRHGHAGGGRTRSPTCWCEQGSASQAGDG